MVWFSGQINRTTCKCSERKWAKSWLKLGSDITLCPCLMGSHQNLIFDIGIKRACILKKWCSLVYIYCKILKYWGNTECSANKSAEFQHRGQHRGFPAWARRCPWCWNSAELVNRCERQRLSAAAQLNLSSAPVDKCTLAHYQGTHTILSMSSCRRITFSHSPPGPKNR